MSRPFEVLTPSDLRQRTSLKWQHYGPDVLPLWVAEMDVLPAPEIVEALTHAIRTGDTGYPGSGSTYAEAFAAFAEQRWGWCPAPADSLVCADVMTGIRVLIEALVPADGVVVIPSPVYPPFSFFAKELGRRVVPVPLTDRGRLDVAAIEAALREETPGGGGDAHLMLLLCSPHNPTGVVHSADELRAVAETAERTGATVVVDEVHAPLVPDRATFVPWLSVAESGLVVTSAAKAFNLAGLKAALIMAGRQSRPVLRRLPESVRYGASHLGVIGHVAAYRSDPGWLDEVNANIADNRSLLASLLAARIPEIGYQVPEATYLAWLDLRALDLGDDPADPILKRAGVALTPGPPFGPGSAGHARLNLACSTAVMTEAVERMASVVGAG
jgi:cystathionine beta-lyase